MGRSQHLEPKLFYHNISLEQRVPKDHPLRRIKQLVDFNFIRLRVADLYGNRGNVSVDPAVILKLMFLLFFENVKSERQLMAQLPLRLDWLWFCDYDLDEQTPHHSVISKARRRWGPEVFDEFFLHILQHCVDAGLVDGETIHIDSSMIKADAGIDKLRPQLRVVTEALCQKLDEPTAAEDSDTAGTDLACSPPLNQRVSPADPDARLGKKYSQTTLGYKDHRAVDDRCGIITATVTTPANEHDGKLFRQVLEAHEANTSSLVGTAVADKIYGMIENYKYLHAKGVKACISHQKYGSKRAGKFSHDQFWYDRNCDCYICPAGQQLFLYDHKGANGQRRRYRAKRSVCASCSFFEQCVSSKTWGRQVSRNVDAEYVEWADGCFSRYQRKRLQGRRMHKAEGSFADASNNHGFGRARWRGLWKMQIQNLMIAAIQNLRKLLRWVGSKTSAGVAAAHPLPQLLISVCFLPVCVLYTSQNSFLPHT